MTTEIQAELVDAEGFTTLSEELDDIWGYLLTEYEIPDNILIGYFLRTAFRKAIEDCGSGIGAVVGFQHAVGKLAEDSMEMEMDLFKGRVH